jgi:hypothetical protein
MSVCVCIIALVIRDSKRIFSAPYCIVICRLSGYIVFFHITLQRHNFGGKKSLLNTVCFDFSLHCLKHFLFYEKFSEMFPSTYIDFN